MSASYLVSPTTAKRLAARLGRPVRIGICALLAAVSMPALARAGDGDELKKLDQRPALMARSRALSKPVEAPKPQASPDPQPAPKARVAPR